MLIYDTHYNWWTLYDIPACALANFRRQDRGELHHAYSTGPVRVGRCSSARADRGTADHQPLAVRLDGRPDPNQQTPRKRSCGGPAPSTCRFTVDFNRGQQAATWPTGRDRDRLACHHR